MWLLIVEPYRQLPSTGHFLGCAPSEYGKIEPSLAGTAWGEHSRAQRLFARARDHGALEFLSGVYGRWRPEIPHRELTFT
jgi:hypothetical protein